MEDDEGGTNPTVEQIISWVEQEMTGGQPISRKVRCKKLKDGGKDYNYVNTEPPEKKGCTLLNRGPAGKMLKGDVLLEWVGMQQEDERAWEDHCDAAKVKSISRREKAYQLYLHCVPGLTVIDWDAGTDRAFIPELWKKRLPHVKSCSNKGWHFFVIVKDIPDGAPHTEQANLNPTIAPKDYKDKKTGQVKSPGEVITGNTFLTSVERYQAEVKNWQGCVPTMSFEEVLQPFVDKTKFYKPDSPVPRTPAKKTKKNTRASDAQEALGDYTQEDVETVLDIIVLHGSNPIKDWARVRSFLYHRCKHLMSLEEAQDLFVSWACENSDCDPTEQQMAKVWAKQDADDDRVGFGSLIEMARRCDAAAVRQWMKSNRGMISKGLSAKAPSLIGDEDYAAALFMLLPPMKYDGSTVYKQNEETGLFEITSDKWIKGMVTTVLADQVEAIYDKFKDELDDLLDEVEDDDDEDNTEIKKMKEIVKAWGKRFKEVKDHGRASSVANTMLESSRCVGVDLDLADKWSSPDVCKDYRYLWVFNNGVIDVREFPPVLRPALSEELLLKNHGCGYDWVEPDPDEVALVEKNFKAACRTTEDNKRNPDYQIQNDSEFMYKQAKFGHMVEHFNKFEEMLVLTGGANNGKSFDIRQLETIFGNYAGTINPVYFQTTSKNASEQTDYLYKLRKKRLVSFQEIDPERMILKSQLAGFTGRSVVKCRAFNKEEDKQGGYTPGFDIICAANDMPQFQHDSSDATARRVAVMIYPWCFVEDTARETGVPFKRPHLSDDESEYFEQSRDYACAGLMVLLKWRSIHADTLRPIKNNSKTLPFFPEQWRERTQLEVTKGDSIKMFIDGHVEFTHPEDWRQRTNKFKDKKGNTIRIDHPMMKYGPNSKFRREHSREYGMRDTKHPEELMEDYQEFCKINGFKDTQVKSQVDLVKRVQNLGAGMDSTANGAYRLTGIKVDMNKKVPIEQEMEFVEDEEEEQEQEEDAGVADMTQQMQQVSLNQEQRVETMQKQQQQQHSDKVSLYTLVVPAVGRNRKKFPMHLYEEETLHGKPRHYTPNEILQAAYGVAPFRLHLREKTLGDDFSIVQNSDNRMMFPSTKNPGAYMWPSKPLFEETEDEEEEESDESEEEEEDENGDTILKEIDGQTHTLNKVDTLTLGDPDGDREMWESEETTECFELKTFRLLGRWNEELTRLVKKPAAME